MSIKKTKKTKRYKKISKRSKIIISLLFLVLASCSFFFFFRAYQYITNIPPSNNLTQEEIYKLTSIKEADIKLIRALKNDAFDSWLYEANDEKVKQLQKKQRTIETIIEGKVAVSAIDPMIAELQESMEVIKEADIEELYILYYQSVLPKQYDKAKHAFKKMTVNSPKKKYQVVFSLMDLLNKIYNQKGMLTVINGQSFKQSVYLLNEINTSIHEVNQLKASISNYRTLTELIFEPRTQLGMELTEQVDQVNEYLQSKLMVNEFDVKFNQLQANLSTNEQLIQKSVKVPDLIGLTVEEAQKKLAKMKVNVTIQGYTNKQYKDGDPVPESQRNVEAWDGDKKDIVIKQEPSFENYDYMLQGLTIRLIVDNKAVEKKVETETSSSDLGLTSSSSEAKIPEETTTSSSSAF